MTDEHDAKAREILDDPRNFVKDPVAGPIPMHFNAFYEAFADALRQAARKARKEALLEAAEIAEAHAEFCHKEAHHGGSHDLYERASGAAHLAKQYRTKAEQEGRKQCA